MTSSSLAGACIWIQLVFDNLKATPAATGCFLDYIIDFKTFYKEPENPFSIIIQMKQTIFPKPPFPSWTVQDVTWLAGFNFEIKVIVRVPTHQ